LANASNKYQRVGSLGEHRIDGIDVSFADSVIAGEHVHDDELSRVFAFHLRSQLLVVKPPAALDDLLVR
jgi:hypothetical protein